MIMVERNQWLPAKIIEQHQFEKVKRILHYAYRNVEFYKRKLEACAIRPEDIKSRQDFLRVPVTTKREVLDNFPHNLLARGYRLSDCRLENTSGSSGLKLQIALSDKAKDFCDCVYGRALFAIGYKPWQPMAYFWPKTQHRKELHEYLGLMRKDWIVSHLKAEEQLSILLRLKPKIIYCFPSILVSMAKTVERNRERYVSIRPEFIVSHAELLTEDARRYIESIFRCPVYNEYGATEFGFRMAWECKERRGLHIDADSVLIEFLNNGHPVEPAEEGEIVVTGLINYAMPLIRYQIGDIGMPSARRCVCGRGLPLMEFIEGRKDDFIVSLSGRYISPRAIIPLIEKHKDITEFRIIQDKKDHVTIYIVAKGIIYPETEDELRQDLSEMLGKGMCIAIETVKEIPRTERGKLRAVISCMSEKEEDCGVTR